MMRLARQTVAVSLPHGGALAAGASHDLRPWRVPALLMGAALACLAALALASFPAPTAPDTHPTALRHGLQSHLATRLPVGLAAAASASIGASERNFWPVRHGASLLTQGGGIHSTFTASGARLRVAQGTLGLSLTGLGRGQRVEHVATVAPNGAASQILYRHGSISEFYRNGPYGLEQGFTVRQRPQAGTGSLVLALGLGGSLIPEQVGSQILFKTQAGATALRYGELSAQDATGRGLPAHMQIAGGLLQLRIDDANARYPLRIDPFIQQGSKLTGGEESGKGLFGRSVALSGDGNTALIGGETDNINIGAAWVFTRSGSTWTQQVKLTGASEVGPGRFGASVALSADGNTAVIGGIADSSSVGAAWVFTRSGSTWTQQAKLTGSGEGGEGQFGVGVALSGDGNTALIGGFSDSSGVGAAWVFTRSGSVWTQQGEKLTGKGEIAGGAFGVAVALSKDGNTALIGGFLDNTQVGAAWVFTRSESKWTQQGGKLTGKGESGKGGFGINDSLSGDGNTAVIGGSHDNKNAGAVWVFARSGSTWTEQGAKHTGGGESGEGFFGSRVALSGDGNTVLIGGPKDNSEVGAAWVFVNPPTVTTVSPNKGASAGATTVTVTGTNLTGATAVKFGSTNAASFAVNSATSITAVSPAETAGTVDVTVTTTAGTSAVSAKDHFKFGPPTVTNLSPNKGSKAGGTSVTVTGTGFALGTTATTFAFGSTAAASVNCTSITTCTVVSPAHALGTVDVKATVSKQVSPKNSPADQFSFN
jgi:hypothetical protein